MEVSNDATVTSEGEEDEDQAGGDGKDDDPLAEGTAVGDEQLPTGPRGPAHVVAVDETSDSDAARALQVAQRRSPQVHGRGHDSGYGDQQGGGSCATFS